MTLMFSETAELTRLVRVALIVAAQRRATLTVRELGAAIGVDDVEFRRVLPEVLALLAEQCAAERMPALTALVINPQTGAPGHIWPNCNADWFSEVQLAFRRWGSVQRDTTRSSEPVASAPVAS
ncbi:MAG TPA: hypothetical protein VEX15_12780 [Nocardioidaceae bacterium]|nr:hypothetical protein [Nocardioidaceae bacterium]